MKHIEKRTTSNKYSQEILRTKHFEILCILTVLDEKYPNLPLLQRSCIHVKRKKKKCLDNSLVQRSEPTLYLTHTHTYAEDDKRKLLIVDV